MKNSNSMNAVIGSIIENLRHIQITYSPTVEIFRGDRTNTGDSKEFSVNEFISSYFTNDYCVKKGKIYSLKEESNNIDCVVLSPNHPKLVTPIRDIILAEGVFCAIEVKPDISVLSDSSEFLRGLNQIKSVKNINREVEKLDLKILKDQNNYPPYFDKIPGILFSKKSADIPKMIQYIRKQVINGSFNKEELPDVIFSIENGLLYYCPYFKHTNIYNRLNSIQKKVYDSEVFIHYKSEEQHINLLLFISFILKLKPPHITVGDFFINKYLDTSIYSDKIKSQLYLLDERKLFKKIRK